MCILCVNMLRHFLNCISSQGSCTSHDNHVFYMKMFSILSDVSLSHSFSGEVPFDLEHCVKCQSESDFFLSYINCPLFMVQC